MQLVTPAIGLVEEIGKRAIEAQQVRLLTPPPTSNHPIALRSLIGFANIAVLAAFHRPQFELPGIGKGPSPIRPVVRGPPVVGHGRFKIDKMGWAGSQRTGLINGGRPGDCRRVVAGEATELR